jgi:AcrR family transcriptional regulator
MPRLEGRNNDVHVKVISERRAGRPTSAATERLNEKIVQAAFTVFVREGFAGATIEQIAQESRTTRRSVLSRFRDKETLLFAVVDVWLWRLRRAMLPSEAVLSAKPLDALKDTCRQMLQSIVSEESVDFYRLCIAQAPKFPKISAAFIRVNDQLAEDLEILVQRAQRTGAFPGRDPAMMATCLIGVFISNPVNRTTIGDPHFRDPPMLQAYFDGLWELVRDTAYA